MKTKNLYLVLCLLGTVLPYSMLIQFLRDHGLNMRLFFEQLFANPVSSFFGLDVIVSTICLWVFIYFEGRRMRVPHRWIPVVASLTVGLSLALPLFLYLREIRFPRQESIA
jgi:hypothetical protein